MHCIVTPKAGDGLSIDVDSDTARRIVRALHNSEDVDDQDTAFIIDQALRRWSPPQGE